MKRWTIVSIFAALVLMPLVGLAEEAAPPPAAAVVGLQGSMASSPGCPTALPELFGSPPPAFLASPQFCQSRRCGEDEDCVFICGCEGGSCVYRSDCGFLTCLSPLCGGGGNN